MEDQAPSPQQDKPTAMLPDAPATSSGGVMDVHHPKSAPAEQPAPAAAASESSPSDTAPSLADEHPTSPTPAAPAEHTTDSHHLLAAHGGEKRGPTMAIILAVVIALALAGVAAYAYMQSNKTKTEDHTNHSATQQEAEVTPDTEIDSLTSEIDQLPTTVDDNKDLPESDLTDQSLGI